MLSSSNRDGGLSHAQSLILLPVSVTSLTNFHVFSQSGVWFIR